MTTLATFSRNLTCAAAAILITFVVSASFVQSTSAAPFHGARTTQSAQTTAAVQAERA